MIYNLGTQFSSRTMRNYAQAWERTRDQATRFSDRTMKNYSATGHLAKHLSFLAATGDAPAEILLYDEIGYWGVTAKDFVNALAAAGDGPLTLRINSPGGDVFDGLAIYNALRARKAPVTVVVDGLAASAASFIAMAGTTVSMAEQSMLMIHNAWGICMGDRNDMLDMAAVMEKIDGQLGDIYAKKSGKGSAVIRGMMDDETWFTSSEAKDAGLCDAIVEPPQADALAKAVRLKAATSSVDAAVAVAAAVAPIDPVVEVVTESAAPDAAALAALAARRMRARLAAAEAA
jgi:ATP-dependent Clp protease protease subunit